MNFGNCCKFWFKGLLWVKGLKPRYNAALYNEYRAMILTNDILQPSKSRMPMEKKTGFNEINPCYNEHIFPVPSHFVISRGFHCIECCCFERSLLPGFFFFFWLLGGLSRHQLLSLVSQALNFRDFFAQTFQMLRKLLEDIQFSRYFRHS